ncbi:MAG: restriction endonuclease subunit S [Balneolaceae bacterium]|nr:restriction endonuclease subunit S [Balneolaceae bacterium]
MLQKLENIADVRFGNPFKSSDNRGVAYFQVNNLNGDGQLDESQLVYIPENDNIDTSDYLQTGDILLPAKGSKFTSAIVPKKYNTLSVASSSLFVIRAKNNGVLPEYLQWYLNLPRTRWELEKGATGTNISSLSIKYLRKLKIEVPDLYTQNKLIRLKYLQEKEAEILNQLLNARKKLVQAITRNIIDN